MKKLLYLLTVIALLVNTTACTDILDQMPHNSISGTSMWTTEEQVDQGVIGVYYSIQNPVQGGDLVGQSVNIGCYGFDVYGMVGQGSYGINNLFTTGVNPGNGRVLFTWKWCYDGIHRANAAIAYIPDVKMSETKKAKLIAECKILRAFFYTRLNQLFGNGGLGVPVYLEPIIPTDAVKGQTPEAEVWEQVVRDLTDAINETALPNNNIMGEGRVSRGAAYALRGRAYLLMKEYSKAADDFAKVGEMGYKLYPDYKQLFKLPQERCEEMIFSVQYIEDPTGYGSRIQKFCGPHQAGAKDQTGCWTDLQISPSVVDLYEVIVDANTVKPFKWSDFLSEWDGLSVADRKVYFIRDSLITGTKIHSIISNAVRTQVNSVSAPARALYLPEGNEARLTKAYTNRDPRMDINIIVPYSHFLGVTKDLASEAEYVSRWPVPGKYFANEANAENNLRPGVLPTLSANAQGNFYYMFRKFIGEGFEYQRRESNPIDEPIIRYADVLLLWAEALVEMKKLTGVGSAMEKVKQVRDRAKVPTMASSFANQDIARNYVRDERRREFVGEGVNFFDEMRWRTLKETKFDNKSAQVVWGGASSGTAFQWIGDQWYTWPVPKTEIEMNPNLTKTPGWVY